jgi:hypothetical protein
MGRFRPALMNMLTNFGITKVNRIKKARNRKEITIIGYWRADLMSDLILFS